MAKASTKNQLATTSEQVSQLRRHVFNINRNTAKGFDRHLAEFEWTNPVSIMGAIASIGLTYILCTSVSAQTIILDP